MSSEDTESSNLCIAFLTLGLCVVGVLEVEEEKWVLGND
jgi:hypothetical protein